MAAGLLGSLQIARHIFTETLGTVRELEQVDLGVLWHLAVFHGLLGTFDQIKEPGIRGGTNLPLLFKLVGILDDRLAIASHHFTRSKVTQHTVASNKVASILALDGNPNELVVSLDVNLSLPAR